MPEYCTCGAQLPPDALFCHKCGKPQREPVSSGYEPEPEVEEPVEPRSSSYPSPRPAALEPQANARGFVVDASTIRAPIGFHDGAAVRISLFCAAVASLLIIMPFLVFGCPLWLLGSGFLAAHLYSKRTGHMLSPAEGGRIGWITGIFCFVIQTVMFTITYLTVSSAQMAEANREQLSRIPWLSQDLDKVMEQMQDPVVQVIGLVLSLVFLFVVFTLLPVIGGWVSARVSQRD